MESSLNKIEILLRNLLSITTTKSDRLSEVITDHFNFFGKQVIKILKEEYQRPKNDWRILCGCLLVIGKA
jgi:hypothetical protein